MITAEEARKQRKHKGAVLDYIQHLDHMITAYSVGFKQIRSTIPESIFDGEIVEIETLLQEQGFSVDVVLGRQGDKFIKEFVISW